MKIYLDTSVISVLFDERNPERKSLTEEFFLEIENYEVYNCTWPFDWKPEDNPPRAYVKYKRSPRERREN